MRVVSQGYIGICTAIFLGIGLWCLVDPAGALAPTGVVPEGRAGLVELRAMYGGLEVGMACFLAWCLGTARLRTACMAAGATIGGLGLARLTSYGMVGSETALHLLLAGVELAGGLAGLTLFGIQSDE